MEKVPTYLVLMLSVAVRSSHAANVPDFGEMRVAQIEKLHRNCSCVETFMVVVVVVVADLALLFFFSDTHPRPTSYRATFRRVVSAYSTHRARDASVASVLRRGRAIWILVR